METPRKRPVVIPQEQLNSILARQTKVPFGHYRKLCHSLMDNNRIIVENFTEKEFVAVRKYVTKRNKMIHRKLLSKGCYLLWLEDVTIKI